MREGISHSGFQSAVEISESESFFDGIRYRYQGFQAPFSERRLVLRIGDSMLLAMATVISIVLTDLVTSAGSNIQLPADRWHWLSPWFAIWAGIAHLNDLYDIPTSYNRTLTAYRVLLTGQLSLLLYLLISFALYPLSTLSALVSLVMAIPAQMVDKALKGMEALYRRGIRYPISYAGAETDVTASFPRSYDDADFIDLIRGSDSRLHRMLRYRFHDLRGDSADNLAVSAKYRF